MRPEIKRDFSRFLQAAPGRLHMAAHSHHYWPDAAFDAHMAAWEDAARLADGKWEHVFSAVYGDVRRGIARLLNLPDPATICFAPNTHEFVLRLISCLPQDRPLRVLTTDSEFYSFDRQICRLEEEGLVEVRRVPAAPLAGFTTRFSKAAAEMEDADLVYVSQVFFNSGFLVTPLTEIVRAVKNADTLVVIDGYHGFMAVPTDLSAIADRAFFMAGGYKYAMSGEGVCFMHCPPGFGSRPRNTGWFAEFGALGQAKTGGVDYGADASRFSGATADPTGAYRMRAVFAWMAARGVTVEGLHAHAHHLQAVFVDGLGRLARQSLSPAQLAVPLEEPRRGNFLTFRTPAAAQICAALKARQVITDHRGDCLRFGFGLYHDEEDVARLLEIIEKHVE